jgi:hypothetical protein
METVENRVAPYNTGKVQIGLLYQPKSSYIADYDASVIQGAMLSQRYKESKWYYASGAMTVGMHIATVCLWAFALFVIVAKW